MSMIMAVNRAPKDSPESAGFARGYRFGADVARELARARAQAYREVLADPLIDLGDAIESGNKLAMALAYARVAEAFAGGSAL
jgi:hypothetical protein